MEADQGMSNHCLEKILSLQTGDIAIALSFSSTFCIFLVIIKPDLDQANFSSTVMIEKGKGTLQVLDHILRLQVELAGN